MADWSDTYGLGIALRIRSGEQDGTPALDGGVTAVRGKEDFRLIDFSIFDEVTGVWSKMLCATGIEQPNISFLMNRMFPSTL